MEIRKERIGDPFVATVDGRLDSIDSTSAAAAVSRMVKRKRAAPASDSPEADFGSKRIWATRRGAFQYFHVELPLVPGCRGGRPRIRVAVGACERRFGAEFELADQRFIQALLLVRHMLSQSSTCSPFTCISRYAALPAAPVSPYGRVSKSAQAQSEGICAVRRVDALDSRRRLVAEVAKRPMTAARPARSRAALMTSTHWTSTHWTSTRWASTLLASTFWAALLAGEVRAQTGPFLYLPHTTGNNVSVVDTSTGLVGSSIPTTSRSFFPAVSGDGSFVYVSNYLNNTVTPINTGTNLAGTPIPVGVNPYGIAMTPDGTTVYVANNSGGSVSVINTATNTVTATIAGFSSPTDVVVSPDGKTAYVTDQTSGQVTPIDIATHKIGTPITVGGAPFFSPVSPDGKNVYVANSASGTVSVINTATNVVATVTVAEFTVDVV